MIIRNYQKEDEEGWLECRLLSFYRSSYYDDVIFEKPTYTNDVIDLIAEEDGKIIGLIEIEVEDESNENTDLICYLDGKRGGNIWNLAVLPAYQKRGIASQLLEEAIQIAKKRGITRFEAWTQDDKASMGWYEKCGFDFRESYLNVYAKDEIKELDIDFSNIGPRYGIRLLNFEAPIERKDELRVKYQKVHEVILYERIFV